MVTGMFCSLLFDERRDTPLCLSLIPSFSLRPSVVGLDNCFQSTQTDYQSFNYIHNRALGI